MKVPMHAPVEDKVWGKVRHVFASDGAAVSILRVEPGTFCSRHRHLDRINRFVSVDAVIDVVDYGVVAGDALARHRLEPGHVCDIEAGVYHRFEVVQGGWVVEVYFPSRPGAQVRLDDIERLDAGGSLVERSER